MDSSLFPSLSGPFILVVNSRAMKCLYLSTTITPLSCWCPLSPIQGLLCLTFLDTGCGRTDCSHCLLFSGMMSLSRKNSAPVRA